METVWGAQSLQADAPEAEYVFLGHALQSESASARVLVEFVPCGHATHTSDEFEPTADE